MKKLLILLCLMFCVTQAQAADAKKLVIQSGKVKHEFTIELADNDVSREKGLMFRTSLEKNHAMLFVFHKESEQNFWMKNTLIPLDIVFIGRDGKILKIHPMAKPNDLTLIPSEKPVIAALEIAGGVAAKQGIKAGHKVIYPLFTK